MQREAGGGGLRGVVIRAGVGGVKGGAVVGVKEGGKGLVFAL